MQATLRGKRVAITGKLHTMRREDAVALIEDLGGEYVPHPDESTSLLVVGEVGGPLAPGGRPTIDLERARRLKSVGAGIEITTESEFLTSFGGDDGPADAPAAGLYTTQQLSRILEVPAAEITLWVRKKLIEPARVENKLCYFDFGQVASAKSLNELVRNGVSPERLRRELTEIEKWMPGSGHSLSQLAVLERGGDLLVRLQDGRLADTSGQLHFDVEEKAPEPEAEEPAPSLEDARKSGDADELFEVAVALESEGLLEEAASAYHEAMLIEGPQAEMTFNLGNVLFRLGRREGAVERFRQTVELEPEWIESWNNLGNVLGELERNDESVVAFHHALAINPRYADAHYNLAETYVAMNRIDDARRHWKAYLNEDSTSTWADRVRERLEATRKKS